MFLGHVLGVTAVSVGLLSMANCGGTDPLDAICDARCPDESVLDGNASVTGTGAIDSFFRSVVSFKTVAAGVTADIDSELDGIQTSFGVSNADLKASGSLSAAIKAKIDTKYKAKLVVKATPAKCEVSASIAASVTAECQAKANCDVDPGKASFECMGTCTVEADVDAKCSADADVVCNVTAPEFMCMGSCEGSCTTKLTAAAMCTGTCNGTCSGTCEGNTSTETGKCNGTCSGMCTGDCSAVLEASAMCTGTCNGSCKYKPGMASCDARARVECELKADAKAECTGRCDGEFEPPKVDCEASASCQASAKAEAKFQAKCTPPSIDVRWTFDASVSAADRADFDFRMAQVKARLPGLAASLEKAQLVFDAGAELGKDGKNAVSASLKAFGDSGLERSVKARIALCTPQGLTDSAKVVADASGQVSAKLKAGNDVTAVIGM